MSIEKKIENLKRQFSNCSDSKYEKIIEIGREAPRLDSAHKCSENLVHGCQSRVYLHSTISGGLMQFEAEADALISAGLVQLLLLVYNGESPETVLTHKPTYLEELGIYASLSPNRSNGLASMHLRLKQLALTELAQVV